MLSINLGKLEPCTEKRRNGYPKKTLSNVCIEDPLEPISFHKIVSLPGLLFFGIVFSCIILAIEIINSKLCANMLHSILSEDLE